MTYLFLSGERSIGKLLGISRNQSGQQNTMFVEIKAICTEL